MILQRLIELLTVIANSEGNTLKVVANGKPIKDLCMSKGNIVLLRTSEELKGDL